MGTANPYSVEMDSNHTLKAIFEPPPPPTALVGGNSVLLEIRPDLKAPTLHLFALTAIVCASTILGKKANKVARRTRRKN